MHIYRSIKNVIKKVIRTGLYRTGFAWTMAKLSDSSGGIILMYHSVPSSQEGSWIDIRWCIEMNKFEEQMAFLAKHRHVISLKYLIDMIDKGIKVPSLTVAITFDDAYKNVLDIAAPILKKYDLPATLFVPTAIVDKALNMWVDELSVAVRYRTKDHFSEEFYIKFNMPVSEHHLSPEILITRLEHLLLTAPDVETRNRILTEVKNELQPTSSPPRLMMNWDEIRTMIRQYPNIEIGSHSHDHLALDLLGQDQANQQIKNSIELLEHNAGVKPVLFSYPYNRYSPIVNQILLQNNVVAAVGFETATPVRAGANLHKLPRIDGQLSDTDFHLYTLGISSIERLM